MQRNINLCLEDIANSAGDYKNVSVFNLDKLVNCSYDIINIDILEKMKPEEAAAILEQSMGKLRSGGYLHVSFLNIKKVCHAYSISKINNQEFLKHIYGKQSVIDIDYINKICANNNCSIVNLQEKDNYYLSAAIIKKEV